MSFLSNRVQSIKPSPTLAMTAKAKEMKSLGIDVIDLSGGEPDFPTPDIACSAAYSAMNNGNTKYTAVDGTPDLKKAIIDKFKRDNNLDYKPDEIIASTGAKQVLFNAFLATLNNGDEVIIPSSYWVSYPDMVLIADGKPVIVDCLEENHFKITPNQLESAITNKTKWLILNSPNNPTGSLYSREELDSLAGVLRKHENVFVISDDIYEKIVFDDLKFHTLAEVAPDLKNRILTINGVSKSYSMTGWRLGYGAGDSSLIKAMKKIQSQSTSNPCSITQEASVAIMNADQSFLKNWVLEYQRRRDDFCDSLNKINGLISIKPEGAFYAFVNVKGLIGKKTLSGKVLKTDLDVSDFFLDDASVASVAGSAFGSTPYIRMSFANSYENLMKAVYNIKNSIDNLI